MRKIEDWLFASGWRLFGSMALLVLVLFAIIAAIAVPLTAERRQAHAEYCDARGLESIYQEVWHGKSSTTYYACRDPKTGQMYAE